MNTLVLGSDHGGFKLKESIKSHLQSLNIPFIDTGTFSEDSIDYPDIVDTVVNHIQQKEASQGILCCGTGIGVSIRANRTKGIRAAVVHSDFTAQMAKEHNNANIICIGARTTSEKDAKGFIDTWLNTNFEGGRHSRRVEKLDS
ncbi:ribose 5-phosphate isomerase B [Candidatus Marinamargulisbacteria bacterium SCGC AG-343-D04]|nr:ribose 5-phosphate isomerase B [Candidatus Marinamargulisbacteria bacterium SCGC AG-343-D04]